MTEDLAQWPISIDNNHNLTVTDFLNTQFPVYFPKSRQSKLRVCIQLISSISFLILFIQINLLRKQDWGS